MTKNQARNDGSQARNDGSQARNGMTVLKQGMTRLVVLHGMTDFRHPELDSGSHKLYTTYEG